MNLNYVVFVVLVAVMVPSGLTLTSDPPQQKMEIGYWRAVLIYEGEDGLQPLAERALMDSLQAYPDARYVYSMYTAEWYRVLDIAEKDTVPEVITTHRRVLGPAIPVPAEEEWE